MLSAQQRESTLQRSGPLQTAANVIWRQKHDTDAFMSVEDILEGHRDVVIPDQMRDGHFWTFRLLGVPKGDRIAEFYDYRYGPTYCNMCDAQYRFPVCHLVCYLAPDTWQSLWTCPYGHTHQQHYHDEHVQDLLCEASRYRLIERYG